MVKEKLHLIKCRGRIDNGKYVECSFQHIGQWGEESLHKHEAEEKGRDNRKTVFWRGFEEESWWYVK